MMEPKELMNVICTEAVEEYNADRSARAKCSPTSYWRVQAVSPSHGTRYTLWGEGPDGQAKAEAKVPPDCIITESRKWENKD